MPMSLSLAAGDSGLVHNQIEPSEQDRMTTTPKPLHRVWDVSQPLVFASSAPASPSRGPSRAWTSAAERQCPADLPDTGRPDYRWRRGGHIVFAPALTQHQHQHQHQRQHLRQHQQQRQQHSTQAHAADVAGTHVHLAIPHSGKSLETALKSPDSGTSTTDAPPDSPPRRRPSHPARKKKKKKARPSSAARSPSVQPDATSDAAQVESENVPPTSAPKQSLPAALDLFHNAQEATRQAVLRMQQACTDSSDARAAFFAFQVEREQLALSAAFNKVQAAQLKGYNNMKAKFVTRLEEHNAAKGELETALKHNNTIATKLDTTLEEFKMLKAQFGATLEEHNTLKAEFEATRKGIKFLNIRLQMLQSHNDTTEAKLETALNDCNALKAKLETTEEHNKTLEAQLETIRKEYNTQAGKLETTLQENNDTKAELEAIATRDTKKEPFIYTEQISRLTLQVASLEAQLAQEREPVLRRLKRLTLERAIEAEAKARLSDQAASEKRLKERQDYQSFRRFFFDGSGATRGWVTRDLGRYVSILGRDAEYWSTALAKIERFAKMISDDDGQSEPRKANEAPAPAPAEFDARRIAMLDNRSHLLALLISESRSKRAKANELWATTTRKRHHLRYVTWDRLQHDSHDVRSLARMVRYDSAKETSPALLARSIHNMALTSTYQRPVVRLMRQFAMGQKVLEMARDLNPRDSQPQRLLTTLTTTLRLLRIIREHIWAHDDAISAAWESEQPVEHRMAWYAADQLANVQRDLMHDLLEVRKTLDKANVSTKTPAFDFPVLCTTIAQETHVATISLERTMFRNRLIYARNNRLLDGEITAQQTRTERRLADSAAHLVKLTRTVTTALSRWSKDLFARQNARRTRTIDSFVSQDPVVALDVITKPRSDRETRRFLRKQLQLQQSTSPAEKVHPDQEPDSEPARAVEEEPEEGLTDEFEDERFYELDFEPELQQAPPAAAKVVDDVAEVAKSDAPSTQSVDSQTDRDFEDEDVLQRSDEEALEKGEYSNPSEETLDESEYPSPNEIDKFTELIQSPFATPRWNTTPTTRKHAASSTTIIKPRSNRLPKPSFLSHPKSAKPSKGSYFRSTSPRLDQFRPPGADISEATWQTSERLALHQNDDTPQAHDLVSPFPDGSQHQTASPGTVPGKEVYTPLKFQIPAQDFRNALIASTTSGAAFWKHTLYKGPNGERIRVHYCRRLEQAEAAAQYFVNEKVLGFDLEWEMGASFEKHGIKPSVSLIQIASEDRIALFQVSLFLGKTATELMPPTLKAILESSEIAKAGVNIKGDFSRLNKAFGIQGRGIFELSHLYKLVKYSATKPELINKSLKNLATQVQDTLHLPLAKGDVRTSAWSRVLTSEQVEYAATDAYAGLRIYEALEEKRMSMVPTPPRPAFSELDQPILLANGLPPPKPARKGAIAAAKVVDAVEIESVQQEVEEQDMAGAAETDEMLEEDEDGEEKYYTCESDSGEMDEETTKQSQEASDSKTMQQQPPPAVAEITQAEEWISSWRAGLPAGYQVKAPPSSLRAYALWHHQSMELEQIAAITGRKPLLLRTVAQYVLTAVALEDMPHDAERMRQVLKTIPPDVQRYRYRKIKRSLGLLR